MFLSKLKHIKRYFVGRYWEKKGFRPERLYPLMKDMAKEYKVSPLPRSQ